MTPKLRALLSPFRYIALADGSYKIERLLDKSATAVIIPDGVSEIAPYAFSDAKELKKLYLAASVKTVGAFAFSGCTALRDVHLESLEAYTGIAFENSYAAPGEYARFFFADAKPITHYEIPDGTKEILPFAFKGMSTLKTVTFPESLKKIGYDAFVACGLESLTLPDTLCEIGSYAFASNPALTKVTLPASLKALPDGIFSSCSSLTKLSLPKGLTAIGSSALAYSGIATLTLPEGVSYIGESAFRHAASLSEITLSESLATVESYAFYQCVSLKELRFSDALRRVGSYAFAYCNALKTLTFPTHAITVGSNIIAECTSLNSFSMQGALYSDGTLYRTVPYTDDMGDYRLSSDAITRLALTPLLDQLALFSLEIRRTRYIDGDECGRSFFTHRIAEEGSVRTLVLRDGIIVGVMTAERFLPVGIETETYYGEDNNGAGTKALSETMTLTFRKGASV
ncbi:MAG: leucine-rich repeat domain-containing protein [Clostridia bacterium]|nr:leucine-rich repeat domain-containing protein [Clostridia bacterium]